MYTRVTQNLSRFNKQKKLAEQNTFEKLDNSKSKRMEHI